MRKTIWLIAANIIIWAALGALIVSADWEKYAADLYAVTTEPDLGVVKYQVDVTSPDALIGPADDVGTRFVYHYLTSTGYGATDIDIDLGVTVTTGATGTIAVRTKTPYTGGYYNLFIDQIHGGYSHWMYVSANGTAWTQVSTNRWDAGTAGYSWGSSISIGARTFRYVRLRFTAPWNGGSINADAGIDAVRVGNVTFQWGGGWPTCDTVANADFDDSSAWTLQNSASISDSLLTLPGSASPAFAYQSMVADSRSYTVTLVADAVDTAMLTVGFSRDVPALANLAQSDFVSLEITPDELQYEFNLLVSGGVSGYLFLLGEGTTTVDVDYICLEGSGEVPVCSPSSDIFDLDEGSNLGGGFLGEGLDKYGFSQGWRGTEYWGDHEVSEDYLIRPKFSWIGTPIAPISRLATGLFGQMRLLDETEAGISVSYDYKYIPSSITATLDFPDGTNPWLEVWVNDGSGWREFTDEDTRINLLDGSVTEISNGVSINLWIVNIIIDRPMNRSVVSFDFDGQILEPVEIGLAIRDSTSGLPLLPLWAGYDEIELYGCGTGAPVAVGNCVVADPDLDDYGGEPNRYYWQGEFTADATRGGAILNSGVVLYQNVLPPVPGRYQLAVNYDVDEATAGCQFGIRLYDYATTDQFFSQVVNCEIGPGHVYTTPLNLPLQPVELNFYGSLGTVLIDRVCLTSSVVGTRCLNANPLFDQGTTGYTGDMYPAGGYATLFEGGRMAAAGVEYRRADPPYELQLSLSPGTQGSTSTLTVNLGDLPGSDYDQAYTVTTETVLTYSLAGPISGDFGPTLWADAGGLRVDTYCITRSTTLTSYVPPTDPFTCTTVSNSNFENGLTDWTANADVLATMGVASFAAGGEIAQDLGSFDEADATLRWLVKAYAGTDATLWVTSDAGVYSFTHTLIPGQGGFYEETAEISGTTTISVTSAASGLELDFICLYPGDTAPDLQPNPDQPGTVIIPPGSGQLAECVAPPMGILPGTITETLASLWPWGASPTNFEVLMAYNTGWVRFIGCRLDKYLTWFVDDFWGLPLFQELARGRCRVSFTGVGPCGLRAMLELIFGALVLSALIGAINALANILATIEGTLKLIEGSLLDLLKTIALLIGVIGLAILAILGLLILLMALISLLWQIPQEFWGSFRTATTGSTAVTVPLPADPEDPLYNITLGLTWANQIIGGPIAFTLAVLAISIGSIALLLWTIRKFSEVF
jgi:hypothetical protein